MSDRLEELVSLQVRRRPSACAIVDGAVHITYEELESRSNRRANTLIAHGLLPGERVCLLISKSVEAIVSILAILKSGGVYVPLDVTSPVPRLVQMLRNVEPCWLIAHSECVDLIGQCLGTMQAAVPPRIYWVDGNPEGLGWQNALSSDKPDGTNRESHPMLAAQSSLAYLIFTSGSTGQPKGVPITHDSAINFVSWANTHFGLCANDRISCHAPLCFDASIWDVFGALTSGAQLHLVPPLTNVLPNLIAEFIRASGLTQWHTVPSVLTAIANRNLMSYGDFPALRRVISGGERLPTVTLQYWMERLPHVEFTNVYGPTEATIVSSFHTVRSIPTDPHTSVPIGRAITGTQLAVLGADRKPAGVDAVGELYISGAGLSPGYWRDPNKSAVSFCEMPPGSSIRWYRTGDLARMDAAGVFHFHGRADRQIKSRGYRIELDEIAESLIRLPGLAESAVVAVPVGEFVGTRICAAYVNAPGVSCSPRELRSKLAASLPSYMLPTRWLELKSLPRTLNGKIDHCALERRFIELM